MFLLSIDVHGCRWTDIPDKALAVSEIYAILAQLSRAEAFAVAAR